MRCSGRKTPGLCISCHRSVAPSRNSACACAGGDHDTGVAQLFDKKVDPTGEGSDGSNRLQRMAQVQSVYVHVCVRAGKRACFWISGV
jgi:hypothetical protein